MFEASICRYLVLIRQICYVIWLFVWAISLDAGGFVLKLVLGCRLICTKTRGNSILMFFLLFCCDHDCKKRECGVGSLWVLCDIQVPVIFYIILNWGRWRGYLFRLFGQLLPVILGLYRMWFCFVPQLVKLCDLKLSFAVLLFIGVNCIVIS